MDKKLRTLKDIQHYDDSDYDSKYCEESDEGDFVKEEELRQEAIKHIIEIGKDRAALYKLSDKRQREIIQYHKAQLQVWIMKFFNITEEDLK